MPRTLEKIVVRAGKAKTNANATLTAIVRNLTFLLPESTLEMTVPAIAPGAPKTIDNAAGAFTGTVEFSNQNGNQDLQRGGSSSGWE